MTEASFPHSSEQCARDSVPNIHSAPQVKQRFESSRACDDFPILITFLRFNGVAHDRATERR